MVLQTPPRKPGIPITPDTGVTEPEGNVLWVGKPSPATAGMVPFTDGTTVEWEPEAVIDIRHISGGIDLSGSTDMSAELQGAMDDARDTSWGAKLVIPYGRLKYSTTLTWHLGVSIEGGWGSGDGAGGVKSRFPYLLWDGADTDNAIETETLTPPNNWTWGSIRRILLINNTGKQMKSGVVFTSRVDTSTHSDFQVVGCTDYAFEFQGGGINVTLRDWRTDGIGKGSVLWVLSGNDALSLENYTTDNQVPSGTVSGPVLIMDGDAAADTSQFTLTSSGAKIETNKNLPASTPANFWFIHDPANSSPPTVTATFVNTWNAPGGGVSTSDGIGFSPATDKVSLELINSTLTVRDVPAYVNSIIGPSKKHVHTIIAPFGLRLGAAPSASRQAQEIVGEVNVIGSLSHHGKKSAPVTHMATSDLTGTTLYPGDFIMDPATRSSGRRVLRECTVEGTLGTLSGSVTTDTTSGSNIVTVSSTTNLRLGQWINVGGPDNKRITNIDYDTDTVTLHSNASATRSSQAVTFVAPSFRDYSLVEQQSAETDASGWTDATAQAKFNALLEKLRDARVIAP